MKTVTRQHVMAVRLMRAAAAALAAFAAVALMILLVALGLYGPHTLLAPSFFGVFGPPLIEELARPTVVMAAAAGIGIGILVFFETSVAASPIGHDDT